MLLKKDIVVSQKNRIIKYFPYMLSLYKDLQLSMLCNSPNNLDYEFVVCLNADICFDWFLHYSNKYPRLWDLCSKIVSSNYRKRSRVATRFESMFNKTDKPIYFGTLTFTDYVLDKTSVKTRRVYVRRFLKNISKDYLANIDFGDLNSREHYHCIFTCADVSLFKKWKYGFVNVKCVRYDKKSVKHISQYVVKLINHCVKGSAGFLISSRNKKR